MAKARVKVIGLADLLEKLDANELAAEPWTDMVEGITKTMHSRFAAAAPGERFPSTIKYRLQQRPIPLWSKITGDFPFKIRYPFMLDAGARRVSGSGVSRIGRQAARSVSTTSVYHYKRSGTPTRHWIRNILNELEGMVNQALPRVAEAIEERWAQKRNAEPESSPD